MKGIIPAKIFQMRVDWVQYGPAWRKINYDHYECYFCEQEFQDGETLSIILTNLGNHVICHDCAVAYKENSLDMRITSLCDTCILQPMCERWRRVQDACLDPIIPGRAVIAECEAYRVVPRVQEVLDGGRDSATAQG